ncbi:Na+/H+ antiporter nhaP (plasmid) [Roseomonas mucosa]|uniref:cation:proton antiporter domain-containing protein n=1 Tax=Roseomonas TaxID=125216 RepID=UPI001868D6AC|nr:MULTISPECIES: cation:proton antiporter [Roseomonas]UZO99288.1 Na+/H+ antiporter nhaP [Roseomonas mucosa]
MSLTAIILSLVGCLLMITVLVQVLAARTTLPEATLLFLAGIALGSLLPPARAITPCPVQAVLDLLIEPVLPAEAHLWVFLPPLLFQSALAIEFREMLPDLAPILLLALVAVFVATAVTGFTMQLVSDQGLVICLLPGAIIATTDPAAVIAVFREVDAPERLIRLVSGESLLNDAAAIAITGVLLAMLEGDVAAA